MLCFPRVLPTCADMAPVKKHAKNVKTKPKSEADAEIEIEQHVANRTYDVERGRSQLRFVNHTGVQVESSSHSTNSEPRSEKKRKTKTVSSRDSNSTRQNEG